MFQLNTIVIDVKLLKKRNGTEKWKIMRKLNNNVKNEKTSKTKQLMFDAVMVCNG